jgi:hypothetical protein
VDVGERVADVVELVVRHAGADIEQPVGAGSACARRQRQEGNQELDSHTDTSG